MQLTQDQVKGRIKTIAKTNNADARVLMRIFMMERFLERVSESRYADTFIIKGGILVTSMIGVAMRSTMDVDASVKNINNYSFVEGTGSVICSNNCTRGLTGVFPEETHYISISNGRNQIVI